MAGHNKWSKIKHKKGREDARRSKVWTKVIREITVATKLGGPDAAGNPRLRKAIDDAKAVNLPKETVTRAVARGAGNEEETNYEELAYEGYGAGGVAVFIDCTTDNRNRTSGDIRTAFNKNGGNLGATGSVGYMFDKKGHFVFDKSPEAADDGKTPTEDDLLELGMEHGAEDVRDSDDVFEVICAPLAFQSLREAYAAAGYVALSADVAMLPQNHVKISGDDAKNVLKMVDALEDLDDVQRVWSNFDIDADELERLLG